MRTSRRGLLAAGIAGGTGAVLAACGTEAEEPSRARDVELLGATVAAERALERTYGFAADAVSGDSALAVRDFSTASERRHDELVALLEEQGGTEAQVADNPPNEAEAALTGAQLDLEAAVAAYREAAALLSNAEQRRAVLAFLAEGAAELAVIQGLLGEPEAPTPFLTGGPQEPLVASSSDEEEQ